jgi:hypothetical protein
MGASNFRWRQCFIPTTKPSGAHRGSPEFKSEFALAPLLGTRVTVALRGYSLDAEIVGVERADIKVGRPPF